MVGDRRRRVRQAALDALAVLGQIYDSEVLFKKRNKSNNLQLGVECRKMLLEPAYIKKNNICILCNIYINIHLSLFFYILSNSG